MKPNTIIRLILLVLLTWPLAAWSQQAPSAGAAQDAAPTDDVFTEILNVRVVNVEVFVTDRRGQPIGGLGQDEFQLFVDGKRTPITNFYAESGGRVRETMRPIEAQTDTTFTPIEEVEVEVERRAHVILLIDHSRLRANNRKRAFAALREALAELGKEDLVAVVGIEGGLKFYSDFLYDRQALNKILDEQEKVSLVSDVNEAERRRILDELMRGQSGSFVARTSNPDGDQLIGRIQAYAAGEYQRGFNSMRNIENVVATIAGIPGRKALMYVGEGIPNRPGEGLFVEWRNRFGEGSPGAQPGIRRIDFNTDYRRAVGSYDLGESMRRLADSTNRAGVTLYAIDAAGDQGYEFRSAQTEQGATSESVSVVDYNFRAPLEYATNATGGKLLRSSGKLAEQLDDLVKDFESFYSLGFTVDDDWQDGSEHDIRVEVSGRGMVARYREEIRLPISGEREAGATVAALMYQTPYNPLRFRATAGSEAPRDDGTAALPVTLEIPVAKIALLPRANTQAGSLTIYVSTKDKTGNPGKVQTIPFSLAIPDDKIEEALTENAFYTLPLVLRPGDQQVAIGIRDNLSDTFSALRLDVSQFSQSF